MGLMGYTHTERADQGVMDSHLLTLTAVNTSREQSLYRGFKDKENRQSKS